jgi:hypothetical protein
VTTIREIWRSGGTASLVLDLHIKLRRKVRFILRPLPPTPQLASILVEGRLIGHQSGDGCFPEEADLFFSPGFELRIVGRPVRGIITE